MYGQDKHNCENCGAPTKRINQLLELPSCCARCDAALEQNDIQQFEVGDILEGHPRFN